MQLNQDQMNIIKHVIEGKNIFIDGPGGTGKSVTVDYLREHFSDSSVFLAPTGVAALNIKGSTLHSVFKLPLKLIGLNEKTFGSSATKELFDKDSPVKRIVIDEISMVRADVFNAVDKQLRKIRRSNTPFGGIQVIVVGDFYQLPPVLVNNDHKQFYKEYDSLFAFNGASWSEANFVHMELTEIMRQKDATFITNLMKIRNKAKDWESSVEFFNDEAINNMDNVVETDPTYLTTVNKTADVINNHEYEELETQEYIYNAKKTGDFKTTPAPYELKLKVGTKVMFTANTPKYKNGQTGVVSRIEGTSLITVDLDGNGDTVIVKKNIWEEVEYYINQNGELDKRVIGTYEQYPLKYGWAVTIHKSQGQSISNAVIHLGNGCFTHGQLYVALSRIRTLEGMALYSKIMKRDVIVDKSITEFYDNGCRGIGLF